MGFKLCNSAYKYQTYFYSKNAGMIAESWITQGFKIDKLDMEKKEIEFVRVSFKRTKIKLPKFLYRIDLPQEAVDEVNVFFKRIQEKYRFT